MSRNVVCLDIGTCNTRVVVGRVEDDNSLKVIAFGKAPSNSVRNGTITNIDAETEVVKKLIDDTEIDAGIDMPFIHTVLGGAQIECLDSTGTVAINQKESRDGRTYPSEIDENTIRRVIKSAQQMSQPFDKKLMHVIKQGYKIDGRELELDETPVGQLGVRLEMKALLVMGSNTAIDTAKECIQRAGYTCTYNERDLINLKSLAGSWFSVNEEERNLGSIYIDLGGGTTDYMFIYNGSPHYVSSIPFAGRTVTSDIASFFGLEYAEAEKLKLEYGSCILTEEEENEEVIIQGFGGLPPRVVPRALLCQVIVARLEEIIQKVKADIIKNAKVKKLHGSIVLSGGGAMLPGIDTLVKAVFKTSSVRCAYGPDLDYYKEEYRNADYATAVGLLMMNKSAGIDAEKKQPKLKGEKSGLLKMIIERIK